MSTEVKIALLVQRQDQLQREIDENKREADADLKRVTEKAEADIKAERDRISALEAERTKALKWGVMTLGSAVMGMFYWIADKVLTGAIR